MADVNPDVALALQDRVGRGAVLGRLVQEQENAQYGGVTALIDGVVVRMRVGKATPAKSGHFVTVWRRGDGGAPLPFRVDDGVVALLVVVRGGGQVGVFSFSTAVLYRRGIVSGERSSGKRGFRVYAPWVAVTSAQAQRTQAWQVEHYQELCGSWSGRAGEWPPGTLPPRTAQ